jgi:hypothetical protein
MPSASRRQFAALRILPWLSTIAVASTAVSSCNDNVAGPSAPPVVSVTGIDRMAFRVHVDVQAGTVTIKGPGGPTVLNSASFASAQKLSIGDGPSRSLLSDDAVELTTENVTRTDLAFVSLVKFDITITNKFKTVDLVTPTWPNPPAGVEGVLLFPYRAVPTGGDLKATITASPEWNGTGAVGSGAPFSFFNGDDCKNNDDCYRWEAYGSPIVAGGFSRPQTVGFYFNSKVTSFDALLLVAADLRDQAARPAGTISGVVSSPERGPLATIGIAINAGGYAASTDAAGQYSVANVSSGPRTISLTRTPKGCTNPGGARTIRLEQGTSQTADFALVCTKIELSAKAGPDIDIARGMSVKLDGSGSIETSDDPVTWTWTQVSGPDVTGGAGYLVGATPVFTAPASVSSLEFDLRLSDGFTTGAPDRVQVNVMEDPVNALFVGADGNDLNRGTRAASTPRSMQPSPPPRLRDSVPTFTCRAARTRGA